MSRWDDLFDPPANATARAANTIYLDPDLVTGPAADGEASKYSVSALKAEAAEVAATPNGSRNDRLNKAAFKMGQHVGAGTIGRDTVIHSLTLAGQACGLEDAEIDLILRDKPDSGLSQGMHHPRVPDPLEALPEPTVLAAPDPDDPDAADQAEKIAAYIRSKFPLLNWRELWDAEDDDDDWILEPLIPARRLVALFSAPKVGKSLLMLELAVAIARGTPALGLELDQARRVLYVDFENDPRGDIRERLRAMGAKPEELDNLCYLSYPTIAKLDTAAGATELMAVVAEYGCELVVIDTISRAVGGEENDNDTWLAFYRNTGLAMKQAGVACIRLDHTGKDHEKGMRGGSAKYGDVDAVWKLSRVTEDTFRLDCTDTRMRILETEIVLTRESQPLRHKVAGDGRATANAATRKLILDTLNAAGAPRGMGRDGAKSLLREAGVRASNEAISAALKQRKLTLMEDQ